MQIWYGNVNRQVVDVGLVVPRELWLQRCIAFLVWGLASDFWIYSFVSCFKLERRIKLLEGKRSVLWWNRAAKG